MPGWALLSLPQKKQKSGKTGGCVSRHKKKDLLLQITLIAFQTAVRMARELIRMEADVITLED